MPRNLDLPDLQVLVAVAESGSMSAASQRLHLALAAVSARVAAMEAEFGASLFVREARGVRTTPAGQLAVRHARTALAALENLRDDLHGGGEVRGRVRLWASTMAVAEHLPPVLGPLLAAHPGLDLQVEEHSSHAVLLAVDEGRADLGVVSGVRIPAGWADHAIATDHLVVLLPAAHPLATRAALHLADLLDERFVGLDEHSGIQEFLEGLALRLGGRLRVVMRARAFDTIGQLVGVGAGIAVLPATSAARLRPEGTVSVTLADPWAARELRACAPPQRHHTAAFDATWAALTRPSADGVPPRHGI